MLYRKIAQRMRRCCFDVKYAQYINLTRHVGRKILE
jgi:hypothetical protein